MRKNVAGDKTAIPDNWQDRLAYAPAPRSWVRAAVV